MAKISSNISQRGPSSLTITFCIHLLLVLQCEAQEDPPLETVVDVGILGSIRGTIRPTFINYINYVEFAGIPYAKPPTEESRFLPAEAINERLAPEGETFNATENNALNPIQCHQPGLFPGTTVGTEDCLILNVMTPKLPSDGGTNYPVIIFIHGGAFLSGYSTAYKADRFIEAEEVIVVTINYRLGILGFLCLENDDIPGNAALYDVLIALHWVKNYISYFGGDPNSITVTGQSSGAVITNYLMASPLVQQAAEPLFHRAIALSGSAFNPWAINENPKIASLKIAKLAECSETDDEADANIPAIVACMRTVAAEKLVNALTSYQASERFAGRLGSDAVSPVIQRWLSADPAFIAQHPRQIFNEGRQMNIPFMSSAAKHDGSFPLGVVYNRYLNCADCEGRINDEYFLRKELIPTLLKAMGIHDDTSVVYDALAETYLREAKNSGNFSQMVYGLLDLHSVFFFKTGVHQTVELHSKLNPNTYLSSFEYAGENSFFEFYFIGLPMPDVPGGIAHGDDLFYLLVESELNPNSTAISERMVGHWINFAKTGNPNPRFSFDPVWPAYKQSEPGYLQLIYPLPVVREEYPETFAYAADDLRPAEPDEPTTTTTTTTSTTTTTPTSTTSTSTTPSTTTTISTSTTTPSTTTTQFTAPTSTTTDSTITTSTTPQSTSTPSTTTTTEQTDSAAAHSRFGLHDRVVAIVIFTLLYIFL